MSSKLRSSQRQFRRYVGRKQMRSRRRIWLSYLFTGVSIALLGFGIRQASGFDVQSPQAIFVLGGAPEREDFAAQLAQQHPELDIWVSSGSNPEYAEWVFSEAQVDPERVHLDYQAVDTVTNFTTLVDTFEAQDIRQVYLVTSDYHMRRAQIIGQIVFGSRGIRFEPVPIPTGEPPESWDRAARDGARALLWVITGKTGSTLHPAQRYSALSEDVSHLSP